MSEPHNVTDPDAVQLVCQSASDDTLLQDRSSSVDEMSLQVGCLDILQRNPPAVPAPQ